MKQGISTLLKYMDDIGATNPSVVPDSAAEKSLPVFVSQIYGVYKGILFGQAYFLLFCTGRRQPAPGEVAVHAKLARSALGPNIAFVFLTLSAFERRRLIERRIPFIVPGRQTYLPMVMIDIREKATGGRNIAEGATDALSVPAQVLLLFQLQKKQESDEWPLNTWGDALGYSRSTMTRVHKQLTSAGLCDPVGRGRHVVLQFHRQGRELWEAALPYLRSPVAGRSRARVVDRAQVQLYEAAMTALAKYTVMAPDRDDAYALSSSAFRAASEGHKVVQTPYPDEDTVVIERWKYAPGLLSQDGQTVDRLSLYLSLQEDRDERVQAALKILVGEMQW